MWVTFFAPSVSEFTVPILQRYMLLPFTHLSITEQSTFAGVKAIIASIGPTTSTFLRDKMSLHVAATAQNPEPMQLADAIEKAQRSGQ